MESSDDLRLVLKELFTTYETSFTTPGDGFNWMECASCGQKGNHNEITSSFEKIKHKDECQVKKMRLRILNIINLNAV
jgi:hypothetical protein